MKRSEIVSKLINEGFSEKTLINLSDNQLEILSKTIFGEQISSTPVVKHISNADKVGIQNAQKNKEQFVTYEGEMEEKEEHWIKDAIHPSKKGSLKKELGVKKNEKIPINKLNSAAKKGGKIGERARLAKTLSKLNEMEETKKWIENLVIEKKYHSLTTKNEIMELISSKLIELDEQETMIPMPKTKATKGHNGIPEFMKYDSIVSNEPATKPAPDTNPTIAPGKPKDRPKPKTPYQPGPGVNPKPKAMGKKI